MGLLGADWDLTLRRVEPSPPPTPPTLPAVGGNGWGYWEQIEIDVAHIEKGHFFSAVSTRLSVATVSTPNTPNPASP